MPVGTTSRGKLKPVKKKSKVKKGATQSFTATKRRSSAPRGGAATASTEFGGKIKRKKAKVKKG